MARIPFAEDEIKARLKEVTLRNETQVIGYRGHLGSVSAEIYATAVIDREIIGEAPDLLRGRRNRQVLLRNVAPATMFTVFGHGALLPTVCQ